jgi:hypothetical protein
VSNFNFTLELESPEFCLTLECVMDYQPASGDGWNEPREPESVSLCSAKIAGVEIPLDREQVEAIEAAALAEYESDCGAAEQDRAQERAERVADLGDDFA